MDGQSIVECLANSLMMIGRNNGEKLMLLLTLNLEKMQLELVSVGVVRCQAVDISPLRRVNQAVYLLTTGARESAFRNIKTIAKHLADELINAAKGFSNNYAIKKKDEIEQVAKANH
ncbi:40S ribosomal protein S5-like [Dioscorea cayenensis subsp. rotundata]|uniref:40S ribosomal protein S5-like n=1 Tax=Dioscorea cayennensis subsp. rotundata TaxID=55577 RepID=A0AB40C8Q4_DIOCR|nr:40S ribosomal protein S5-like [Dioscorea cayenensis subsp. rotundata]